MTAETGSHGVSNSKDVELINAAGKGGFVLVCEHASNSIPDEFAGLGLGAAERSSHIAWDIGAFEVAKALSEILDAPLIAPVVSRLVYDCNRPAQAQSAVPEKSEIYDIPGNIGISDLDRNARAERIYRPYRKALTGAIERAVAEGRPPVLVTIHSFTPIFKGQQRDLDLGILHDADDRLAKALLLCNDAEGDLLARLNDPYGPVDGVTYTLAEHALKPGFLNAMVEIRNTLILDADAQQDMAKRLARYLLAAMNILNDSHRREVSSC